MSSVMGSNGILRNSGGTGFSFPDAATTGPAAGGYTSLAPYDSATIPASGPFPPFVSQQGDGSLLIRGALLTGEQIEVNYEGTVNFVGCQLVCNSGFFNVSPAAGGCNFYYCDLGPDGTDQAYVNYNIEGGQSCTVQRCNFHGYANQAFVGNASNSTFAYNYVHDTVFVEGAHNEPFYIGNTDNTGDTSNVSIIGNALWAQVNAEVTAAIFVAGSATFENIAITGNLLAGGGYTMYLGYNPGTSTITGLTVEGNYLSTAYAADCGYYGYATNAPGWGSSGNSWQGNYWYDGANAGELVSQP